MPHKKKVDLGRSLLKSRFKGHVTYKSESERHTAELADDCDLNKINLLSVTEESSLEEFLSTAQLAGTEFTAEKLNVKFVAPQGPLGVLEEAEKQRVLKLHEQYVDALRIPRRPRWTESMTTAELRAAEENSFLEWRRQMALLQQEKGLLLTPYERNLDFWRQLWRVVERSDVVVQIVDARNPLLYRCEDLERYVRELSEHAHCVLLLNKADLLTEAQRRCWRDYLSRRGVSALFFSALAHAPTVAAAAGEAGVTEPLCQDGQQRGREESESTQSEEEEELLDIVTCDASSALNGANVPPSDEHIGGHIPSGKNSICVSSRFAALSSVSTGDSCTQSDGADSLARDPPSLSDANQSASSDANQSASSDANQSASSVANQSASSYAKQSYLSDARQSASSDARQSASSDARQSASSDASDVSENSPVANCGKLLSGSGDEQWVSSGGSLSDGSAESESEVPPATELAPSSLLTVSQLIAQLKRMCLLVRQLQRRPSGGSTVGFVGYPNVGKSSTINALMRAKLTSVSATPGKTKHFQTHHVDDDLVLCDCPGLVMPSFVSSRAEMVVWGVLPIDQMRDHVAPVSYVTRLIPRHVLAATYRLTLPAPREGEQQDRPPTAEEFLDAHSLSRGFVTQHAVADSARSARVVLKHFVSGRLLFCVAPPDSDQRQFHQWPQSLPPPPPPARAATSHLPSAASVDRSFFAGFDSRAHSRDHRGVVRTNGRKCGSSDSSLNDPSKPWRVKTAKSCKKGKLRRCYRHLDE